MRLISFVFACICGVLSLHAQFGLDLVPDTKADTLYFPFDGNVQLIVINQYGVWANHVQFMEMTQPRGMSWSMLLGPAPKNIYLFRNRAGHIINIFNGDSIEAKSLKNTHFTNTNEATLLTIHDYRTYNGHLLFFGENGQVGLINLQGEIVVPSQYDEIRPFQNNQSGNAKQLIFKDNLFGMLDENLKVLFPPSYRAEQSTTYVGYPEHTLIDEVNMVVFKGDKCGLITDEGKVLIDFLYDDIRLIHDNKYIGLEFRTDEELNRGINNYWEGGYKTKSCTVYNQELNVITRFEDYKYILYYGISRFIVMPDNKFGVVDEKGNVIVPMEYDILTQEYGEYNVRKDGKTGVVGMDGTIRIPIIYDNLHFYGQAIYATQNGLIGVFSDKYALVAEPQYKHKTWEMGKFVLTREDGSRGFVHHEKDKSYYQSPEGDIINL